MSSSAGACRNAQSAAFCHTAPRGGWRVEIENIATRKYYIYITPPVHRVSAWRPRGRCVSSCCCSRGDRSGTVASDASVSWAGLWALHHAHLTTTQLPCWHSQYSHIDTTLATWKCWKRHKRNYIRASIASKRIILSFIYICATDIRDDSTIT